MKRLINYISNLFGLFRTDNSNNVDEDSMLFWEDDYLMREIISIQNLSFVKKEIHRIYEKSNRSYLVNDISKLNSIKPKQKETLDLNIETIEILKIFKRVNLERYSKLFYGGIGDIREINSEEQIVFGKYKSAIFVDDKQGRIENIWLSSNNWKDLSKTQIGKALNEIGINFNMILVDWYSGQIIDLKVKKDIDDYLTSK